jgi:hypothetical protein
MLEERLLQHDEIALKAPHLLYGDSAKRYVRPAASYFTHSFI